MNEANTLFAFQLLEQLVNHTDRIATALEAQLELTKRAFEPITSDKIRGARRELLLVYADELGVAAWGDKNGCDIPNCSNDDLRRWCLNTLAGEALTHF